MSDSARRKAAIARALITDDLDGTDDALMCMIIERRLADYVDGKMPALTSRVDAIFDALFPPQRYPQGERAVAFRAELDAVITEFDCALYGDYGTKTDEELLEYGRQHVQGAIDRHCPTLKVFTDAEKLGRVIHRFF